MAEPIQTSKHSLVGKVIADRYEIVSFVGRGAMGTVYKAKHKAIDRFFAVKTLNAQFEEDERVVKRFQQEAQAMSLLTHPNLIQILDYGKTEDGVPFFVMEFLEGISLADHLKHNGQLPVERALPIFAQIADALAHAHSKGVIHRDLKPSNIMLIGDSHDFVKVVDLGIAKAVSDDQHLTQTGEVFGSPLYMSPEQCQGMQTDGRSDIYSLGCLMYEALAARPPLRGENFVQTAYKHMHEMPVPLQEVRPDVSEPVSELIAACLLKNPDDRVASMAMLRDALRELIAATCSDSQANTVGTLIGGKTTLSKATKALPRQSRVNWILVSAVCAIPLLLAAAMGVFVFNATSSRKPPEPPVSTKTASTVDLNSGSTVSVQSPVWREDNPKAPDEIDVVAVYAAQPQIGNSSNQPQDVTIEVRPHKQPITLVLFSYMPVHWNVKPYSLATIKKVIASGFHPQIVEGAGCDVKSVCIKNNDKDAFHTGMMKPEEQETVEESREEIYEQIKDGVRKLLGPDAEIRHFQGQYYGTHFNLDDQ